MIDEGTDLDQISADYIEAFIGGATDVREEIMHSL